MIRVIRDAAGLIYIDGRPDPIAGGLQATLNGNEVVIANTQGGAPIVCGDFGQIANANGSGFASANEAMAYLEAIFSPQPSQSVEAVAAGEIAVGMPLAISRATGQMVTARSDTYALSFVAGLALAAVEVGFPAQASQGALTLSDWTAAVGSSALSPGQAYFLAPEGGLTTSPMSAGALCVARIGLAASSQTLIVKPSDPILL